MGLHRPAGAHFPVRALSHPLQQQSKGRKPRSKSRSKIDLLRKCIEDKIQLFEEQAPEDLAEKVSPSTLSVLIAHTGLMSPQSQGAQSPPVGEGCARISVSTMLFNVSCSWDPSPPAPQASRSPVCILLLHFPTRCLDCPAGSKVLLPPQTWGPHLRAWPCAEACTRAVLDVPACTAHEPEVPAAFFLLLGWPLLPSLTWINEPCPWQSGGPQVSPLPRSPPGPPSSFCSFLCYVVLPYPNTPHTMHSPHWDFEQAAVSQALCGATLGESGDRQAWPRSHGVRILARGDGQKALLNSVQCLWEMNEMM